MPWQRYDSSRWALVRCPACFRRFAIPWSPLQGGTRCPSRFGGPCYNPRCTGCMIGMHRSVRVQAGPSCSTARCCRVLKSPCRTKCSTYHAIGWKRSFRHGLDVESIISPFSLIPWTVSRHEACGCWPYASSTFPKPEKLGKVKARFVPLEFRVHVVDNLIPTLADSVTAGSMASQGPG